MCSTLLYFCHTLAFSKKIEYFPQNVLHDLFFITHFVFRVLNLSDCQKRRVLVSYTLKSRTAFDQNHPPLVIHSQPKNPIVIMGITMTVSSQEQHTDQNHLPSIIMPIQILNIMHLATDIFRLSEVMVSRMHIRIVLNPPVSSRRLLRLCDT